MKLATLLCLLLSLVACHQNLQKKPQGGSLESDIQAPLETKNQEQPYLKVVNLQGEPIEGAQILIGSRLGQPFVNNMIQTNSSGHAVIPNEWTQEASVTIDHPAYIRATYVNVPPRNLTLKLRPLAQAKHLEMAGTTTDFGKLERNNIADFGLVIQALTKQDLFSFSLDKIISTEMDTMSVAGSQVRVPSNLTFPRQRETYVIPVTIEKERYRLYFDEPGQKTIYALHGTFPFQEVVDEIQNKTPFQALVNYFEFTSGSLRKLSITAPTLVDIPVNELPFTAQDTVIAPPLESDKLMLAVSLFQDANFLFPTSLHKAEQPGAFSMKGLNNGRRILLSMLKRSSDFYGRGSVQEATSIELAPMRPNHTPSFLSLVSPPEGSLRRWTNQVPTTSGNITPFATYSVLSKVYAVGKKKFFSPTWEVYSAQWDASVELPEWPKNGNLTDTLEPQGRTVKGEIYHWRVAYAGTDQKLPLPADAQFDPEAIAELTTHLTFNGNEF